MIKNWNDIDAKLSRAASQHRSKPGFSSSSKSRNQTLLLHAGCFNYIQHCGRKVWLRVRLGDILVF